MTIYQQRQYNRFERSVKYIDARQSEFTSGSKALSLRDELKSVLGEFSAAGREQKSANKGTRTYSSAKLDALNALREDLVAIARSAEVIASSRDGFKNTFVLPDRRLKNELADAARQFIRDANAIKDEFLALEMKPNFLDQLQERLDNYEATQNSKNTEKGARAVSTDAVSSLVNRGSQTLDIIDVIIHNKYRDNNEAINLWKEASSLEFTPRRKKGEKTPANAKKAA